jgi:antitoxin MazE
MRISKWGNSLAVRLPVAVVEALDLKPGDWVNLYVHDKDELSIERRPSNLELLMRLRKYRGRMPDGFKFDRLEAHERG